MRAITPVSNISSLVQIQVLQTVFRYLPQWFGIPVKDAQNKTERHTFNFNQICIFQEYINILVRMRMTLPQLRRLIELTDKKGVNVVTDYCTVLYWHFPGKTAITEISASRPVASLQA